MRTDEKRVEASYEKIQKTIERLDNWSKYEQPKPPRVITVDGRPAVMV